MKPTSEVDPLEPGNAATEPAFAAEDEFVARRKRRSRRWRLLLLVLIPTGLLALLTLGLGGEFVLTWGEQAELAKLHAEIAELHAMVISQIEMEPSEREWHGLQKSIMIKGKTIQPRLSKLRSKSAARARLMSAFGGIRSAVREPTPEAAMPKLLRAAKALDDARKNLKI